MPIANPGLEYLGHRIGELELAVAQLIGERAARDERIVELEKNQKKQRPPPGKSA